MSKTRVLGYELWVMGKTRVLGYELWVMSKTNSKPRTHNPQPITQKPATQNFLAVFAVDNPCRFQSLNPK